MHTEPARHLHVRGDALASRWGLTRHTGLHLAVLLAASPGLYVTSGRRTLRENERVGGVPGSWHLQGRAVDLGGPLAALVEARGRARRQRVSPACTGPEEVLLEYPGTRRQHLHVAW